MVKLLKFSIIIFLFSVEISAQELNTDTIPEGKLPKILTPLNSSLDPVPIPSFDQLVSIPKSPEAFAFSKYGNTPISLFNGRPNISIPLDQIQGSELNIPFSITYDASGIKVDQNATEVGLGWNLNLGGMIVRQVNGLPDDYITSMPAYYPFYSTSIYPSFTGMSVNDQFRYFVSNDVAAGGFYPFRTGQSWTNQWAFIYAKFMEEVNAGKIDTQPDTYSLSVNGLSGTLVIDYTTSTAFCREHPEMKVGFGFTSNSFGVKLIDSWVIIDGNGNEYLFGGSSSTKEITTNYDNNATENSRRYVSSWKLNTLKSGTIKENIIFSYSLNSYWNDQPITSFYARENVSGLDCPSPQLTINYNAKYNITSPVLNNIKFGDETTQRLVIVRKSRLDLPGHQAIDYIRVNDEYGNAKNFIKFETDYFSTSNCGTGTGYLGKRLKLNSVVISGNSLTNPNPFKHEFTYDQTALPCRDSFGRDYYGYYNGANGNTTLVPYNSQFGNGGNREVNTSFTQAGILKTIKYPTKGTTEFFYQPNNSPGPSTATWQNVAYFNWSNPVQEAYCDDIVGNSLFVQYFQFTAPTTGTYKLNVGATTSWPSQVQLVALYQGVKSLCELVWASDSDVLYKQYSSAINQETYLTLTAGKIYRVALANNLNSNASINLSLATLQTGSLTFKADGGLRVYKIVDKSSETEVAKTRYFYYNDATAIPLSNLVSMIESGNYISDGKNQAPVLFEKTGTVEHFVSAYGILNCQILERFDASIIKGKGENYSYSTVSELEFNSLVEFQLKVSEFYNSIEYNTRPLVSKDLLSGNLEREKIYRFNGPTQSFQLVQETKNSYSVADLASTHSEIKGIYFLQQGNFYINQILLQNPTTLEVGWGYSPMQIAFGQPQGCSLFSNVQWFVFCIRNGSMPMTYQYDMTGYGKKFLKLDSSSTTEYSGSNQIKIIKSYQYDQISNFQIKEISYLNSYGNLVKDKFIFPDATNNVALFNQNRVKQITGSQKEVAGVLQAEKKISFQTFNSNQVLPNKIEEKFGSAAFSEIVKINSYDPHGNIREIVSINGVPITLIWGHGGKKMILKVEGATYSQVLSSLGGSLTFSDSGRNFTETQITNLRTSLPTSMINHYVYNSPYGVSKVIDQNGFKVDFVYDVYGRLYQSKDHNNFLIDQYNYNIKN
ncbi:hypothetical protein MMU07_11545 [Aquiflexum sp. LQ15W]|uniref:hypothetical protein n=1 Tax=Cognataquiflexum nitidum TaxID=2922272 RepID=UPI001F138217|nr:hypothetical protein [Cognataquiflexum nitidum]MCH6200221.1 hypothetical protein [Cognataquiflexum nitidum]